MQFLESYFKRADKINNFKMLHLETPECPTVGACSYGGEAWPPGRRVLGSGRWVGEHQGKQYPVSLFLEKHCRTALWGFFCFLVLEIESRGVLFLGYVPQPFLNFKTESC